MKVESGDSPATVQVVDTRTGDLVTVVVTVQGTGISIASADSMVELDTANWCIKASNQAANGHGLHGQSASFNKKHKRQAVSYVVIYSVTTVDPHPVVPCDNSTASGGPGVTNTVHELAVTGPTSFVIDYEAFSVPDRFEVFYEGVQVADTGNVGDSINEGTGSITVAVPAGTSTQVTVRVTGPSGTLWNYTVNCP